VKIKKVLFVSKKIGTLRVLVYFFIDILTLKAA
jgi:hypothetical protein